MKQTCTFLFLLYLFILPQDETPGVARADHLLDRASDLFGGERSGQYRLRLPRATVARIALHYQPRGQGRGEKRT